MNFQHDSDSQTRIAQGSLFHQLTHRIQRSLELQDILTATVAELRAFLGIDRVLIYKFRSDGSGQVIAEAMQEERLQSLFGLSFPAGDIPYEVRRLFVETRMRSIADLDTQQIGRSLQSFAIVDTLAFTELSYRPLDPCHAEYLKALGVTSSIVVPILHQTKLWGLLIAHHATRYTLTTLELQDVQGVADQLAVAIAQSSLIDQAHEKAHRETTINQVTTLLHAFSNIEMQAALDETVDALNGVGGRLYIRTAGSTLQTKLAEKLAEHSVNSVGSVKLYVSGLQPIVPPQAPTTLFEEYPIWQTYFKSSQRNSWAIADLYREGRLRTLQPAFQPTNLRGLLLLPLWYRQHLLGFLSIFRAAIDTEILWAGQVEDDRRHAPAQISFEVWKETRQHQAHPWTKSEVALAEALARHFATAVQQHESHQHLQLLNASLEKQVADRTVKLQQQTEQLTQTLNDLQQAQTHLVQTEKMSSLGELVAGVAHEINNPVSFICGNLKHLSAYTQDLLNLLALYQRAAPTPSAEVAAAIAEFDLEFLLDDLPKTLASMQIGADRIRQIVLSLRNFSRFDQTQMKSVNIHDGLDSTIMILQHRLKGMSNRPDIALHKAYGDLPEVMCYAGQLNQVFMNLLSNAIDALEEGMTIPSRPGFMPTIWISTETMPDDRIAIQIIDNGPGMSSATKNQLFQSFFTTKPLGKGTGMGLSISYQIITEKHQGTLSCESRLGEGTTFSIVIPSQPRVIPSMASHRNKTEV